MGENVLPIIDDTLIDVVTAICPSPSVYLELENACDSSTIETLNERLQDLYPKNPVDSCVDDEREFERSKIVLSFLLKFFGRLFGVEITLTHELPEQEEDDIELEEKQEEDDIELEKSKKKDEKETVTSEPPVDTSTVDVDALTDKVRKIAESPYVLDEGEKEFILKTLKSYVSALHEERCSNFDMRTCTGSIDRDLVAFVFYYLNNHEDFEPGQIDDLLRRTVSLLAESDQLETKVCEFFQVYKAWIISLDMSPMTGYHDEMVLAYYFPDVAVDAYTPEAYFCAVSLGKKFPPKIHKNHNIFDKIYMALVDKGPLKEGDLTVFRAQAQFLSSCFLPCTKKKAELEMLRMYYRFELMFALIFGLCTLKTIEEKNACLTRVKSVIPFFDRVVNEGWQ
jgi:hypothetical protein